MRWPFGGRGCTSVSSGASACTSRSAKGTVHRSAEHPHARAVRRKSCPSVSSGASACANRSAEGLAIGQQRSIRMHRLFGGRAVPQSVEHPYALAVRRKGHPSVNSQASAAQGIRQKDCPSVSKHPRARAVRRKGCPSVSNGASAHRPFDRRAVPRPAEHPRAPIVQRPFPQRYRVHKSAQRRFLFAPTLPGSTLFPARSCARAASGAGIAQRVRGA